MTAQNLKVSLLKTSLVIASVSEAIYKKASGLPRSSYALACNDEKASFLVK